MWYNGCKERGDSARGCEMEANSVQDAPDDYDWKNEPLTCGSLAGGTLEIDRARSCRRKVQTWCSTLRVGNQFNPNSMQGVPDEKSVTGKTGHRPAGSLKVDVRDSRDKLRRSIIRWKSAKAERDVSSKQLRAHGDDLRLGEWYYLVQSKHTGVKTRV